MRPIKHNLYRQFFIIIVIILSIVALAIGVFLPKFLSPIYEKTIYEYLKQPLNFIDSDINQNKISDDVAYFYVTSDQKIIASENFHDVIKASPAQVLKKIDNSYGKFIYLGTTYYYNTVDTEYISKISITSSKWMNQMKHDVMEVVLCILLLVFLITAILIIWWSRKWVLKIEHLKKKIEKMDDDNYIDNYCYDADDELKILSDAIDEMKETLKRDEEYKNQMYQNISHDFKTPLTVIKSYIEAKEDEMISEEEAFNVIKEQVNKLETKVHSLLYLNKLNYIKDMNTQSDEITDIAPILMSSIQKFKYLNPTLNFILEINDKKTSFRGTYDMWETIIDNLLSNFIRYAATKIKITVKNGKITFYNDGPNIDQNIINDIFTPYKKGINGDFGLGLSIVKKTVQLCQYEVSIKNEKKGVRFMIK